MPSRSANSRSDRARPAASSSNHACPRAIALISVGSHRERSFCIATPGSTSLISTPRRLKATGAVSSIGLSLGFSDEDDETGRPKNGPRRTLSAHPGKFPPEQGSPPDGVAFLTMLLGRAAVGLAG